MFNMNSLQLPSTTVAGSARAWVTVTGDLMASALDNLGQLVTLPTGCGEQNMASLVPSIYVLKYLEATQQARPDLEEKAKRFMKLGTRRQAHYRHSDGAYSVWGDQGDAKWHRQASPGSSWLTAFVVKSFSQAAEFIEVDEDSLQESVDWLIGTQQEDGCFPQLGYVHSHYLKGGGGNSSITSFILTAVLEAKNSTNVHIEDIVVENAVGCLLKDMASYDSYGKTVLSHTFSLLNSMKKMNLINFGGIQLIRGKARDLVDDLVGREDIRGTSNSKSVEMTGYLVQSLVLLGRAEEAVEMVKWLGRERNSRGGFHSTQDTVVALQALAMHSQMMTRESLDMEITLKTEPKSHKTKFNLNEANRLLVQSKDVQVLTSQPTKVLPVFRGSGCAMVQTVLRYNVRDTPASTGFSLSAQQQNDQLTFCSEYSGDQAETGMVVVTVETVTGELWPWPCSSPSWHTCTLPSLARVDCGGARVPPRGIQWSKEGREGPG